jgi:hypothetical protein
MRKFVGVKCVAGDEGQNSRMIRIIIPRIFVHRNFFGFGVRPEKMSQITTEPTDESYLCNSGCDRVRIFQDRFWY